jgi:hypothetical protein
LSESAVTDPKAENSAAPPEAKLRSKTATLLDEIRRAATRHGSIIQPENDASPCLCIPRPALREHLISAGWFDEVSFALLWIAK